MHIRTVERSPQDHPKKGYAPDQQPTVPGDCLFIDTEGKPVALQVMDTFDTAPIRKHVAAIDTWRDDQPSPKDRGRMNGLHNPNRVFGFTPRAPVRGREGCQATTLAIEEPDAFRAVLEMANVADEVLQDKLPGEYDTTWAQAANTHPDWRIGTSPWTSGIINRTSVLRYHRDSGNYKGSWSAMGVVRRFVRGGHLHLPDWDLTLDCSDGALIYFDGQAQTHGVTPMGLRGMRQAAHRYSVVMYARSQMGNCLPCDEELAYGLAKREEREHSMAGLDEEE